MAHPRAITSFFLGSRFATKTPRILKPSREFTSQPCTSSRYHADVRCLRRIIFNIATATSLLLCVATAVFWIRDLHAMERLSCVWRNRNSQLLVVEGRLFA